VLERVDERGGLRLRILDRSYSGHDGMPGYWLRASFELLHEVHNWILYVSRPLLDQSPREPLTPRLLPPRGRSEAPFQVFGRVKVGAKLAGSSTHRIEKPAITSRRLIKGERIVASDIRRRLLETVERLTE